MSFLFVPSGVMGGLPPPILPPTLIPPELPFNPVFPAATLPRPVSQPIRLCFFFKIDSKTHINFIDIDALIHTIVPYTM